VRLRHGGAPIASVMFDVVMTRTFFLDLSVSSCVSSAFTTSPVRNKGGGSSPESRPKAPSPTTLPCALQLKTQLRLFNASERTP
jgi:hypothetical protein